MHIKLSLRGCLKSEFNRRVNGSNHPLEIPSFSTIERILGLVRTYIIMQYFRNQRTLIRLIAAAFFEWAKLVLAVVATGQLLMGGFYLDHHRIIQGGSISALAIFSLVFGLVLGRRTFCPLCMTPILGISRCHPHRRLKSMMGSARLKVAWDVLVKCRILCRRFQVVSE